MPESGRGSAAVTALTSKVLGTGGRAARVTSTDVVDGPHPGIGGGGGVQIARADGSFVSPEPGQIPVSQAVVSAARPTSTSDVLVLNSDQETTAVLSLLAIPTYSPMNRELSCPSSLPIACRIGMSDSLGMFAVPLFTLVGPAQIVRSLVLYLTNVACSRISESGGGGVPGATTPTVFVGFMVAQS